MGVNRKKKKKVVGRRFRGSPYAGRKIAGNKSPWGLMRVAIFLSAKGFCRRCLRRIVERVIVKNRRCD
jgi:hypothetical protein